MEEFKKRVTAMGTEFCDCWADSVFSLLMNQGLIKMDFDWRDPACMIGLTEKGLKKKEELGLEFLVDNPGTMENQTHFR
jgi:hypothetical protein